MESSDDKKRIFFISYFEKAIQLSPVENAPTK